MKKFKLTCRQLTAKQSIKELGFKTTDALPNYPGVLGQERAERALQFGVQMENQGYNLYIMGESGTGRMSYAKQCLNKNKLNSSSQAIYDWCYINNFDDIRKPNFLKLPPNSGQELQKKFNSLIDELLATFPSAFESPTYQQYKNAIEGTFNKNYDTAIDRIERLAGDKKIALFRDTNTLSFAPIIKGKTLDEVGFAQLGDKQRDTFNKNISFLEKELNTALAELPQWKRASSKALQQLNKKTIDEALKPLLAPLYQTYKDQTNVQNYLVAVQEHLHRSVMELLADERATDMREEANKRKTLEALYAPNIIVKHKDKPTAPIIYESHPSYKNLFGRIEYNSDMGTLITSYRQICSGALHQANGGYLLLDANKILEEPFVWEALKRALKEQLLQIESPYIDAGSINTITLMPKKIPLIVKIILVGSREIYYLLQQLDSDFLKMFKVLVDFDDHIPRTPQTVQAFAQLLKNRTELEKYPAITAAGVACLVEYSSHMAENKEQLSSKIGDLFDLLAEANFIRSQKKSKTINDQHINQALTAKADRTNRMQKQILQEILEGSILIDTSGYKIGKINALTVLTIGDTSFGTPARITSVVYPGTQGIVDIEREASLGQAIHSKGVMILTGYIGNTYAKNFPLSISATIAMEQSYGYIDGDSASVTELCCLISALTNTAINQSFAITGSVNQHGEIQAIGGVNEKIEGFFDLCSARGLTGKQGVVIPAANMRNLMLHKKVIDAVRSKAFSIFTVNHVEEALEILCGEKPGLLNNKGAYPKNTINGKAVQRLKEVTDLTNKDNNS